MRNIVLEGFDGGGKSTLAKLIASRFNLIYQPSEGPEKEPGECSKRALAYMEETHHVFDRHPAVSNDIYIPISGAQILSEDAVRRWKFLRPYHLIVFCADGAFKDQVASPIDTPEYQKKLRNAELELTVHYDSWARSDADIYYHKTDDHRKLFAMIGGFLCSGY